MRNGAEILIDEPLAPRGKRLLEALADALPPDSAITSQYAGNHRLLVLYGVGHPQRLRARKKHLAAGGRVAMWDLGYWDRDQSMRVSIDSFHPTASQLSQMPAESRPHPTALRHDADSNGPILLVGIGRKSAVMYGFEPLQWERQKLREIRERFPGKRIHWRPKGRRYETIDGTVLRHGQPIDEVLKGCSLVVCRHSNVAVDALIAGVPFECEDGAAKAVSASPSSAERLEFLRRLSWFNWHPIEAAAAWAWMLEVTR